MKNFTKPLFVTLSLLAVSLCFSACQQSDSTDTADTTENVSKDAADVTTEGAADTAEPVEETFKFILLPNGTYSVSMNEKVTLEEVEIPSEHNGIAVTQLARTAFRSRDEIKKILIPDSITVIGEQAFYRCSGLTEISLPAALTSVGKNAFHECTGLERVYISDLTAWCRIQFHEFGAQPLYNHCELYVNDTLLTELTIPEELTQVGDFTFSGCTSLTSVTIPNGVTTVGKFAFSQCANLAAIQISDTVTTLDSGIFSDCTGLTSAHIPGSVEILPSSLSKTVLP